MSKSKKQKPSKADIADFKYHQDTQVTCACGNTFTTGSTLKQINVEICSDCHPFFTGKMKFIDTMGRVEKFQKQQKAAASKKYVSKKQRKKKQSDEKDDSPQTLKEMIQMQTKTPKKSTKKQKQ